ALRPAPDPGRFGRAAVVRGPSPGMGTRQVGASPRRGPEACGVRGEAEAGDRRGGTAPGGGRGRHPLAHPGPGRRGQLALGGPATGWSWTSPRAKGTVVATCRAWPATSSASISTPTPSDMPRRPTPAPTWNFTAVRLAPFPFPGDTASTWSFASRRLNT